MKITLPQKQKNEMIKIPQSIPRPFLKWAGGKGQLIAQIRERIPEKIKRNKKIDKYFEPFVGGGAVFFWLSHEYEIGQAYLYDINPEIVAAYQIIKSKTVLLIKELQLLERKYLDLSKDARVEFYYDRREEYNEYIRKNIVNNVVRRSALLIFLNKTCFNGLFRVNSKGEFNVPFGRYENPTICDEDNLLAVARALRNTRIHCADFSECLKYADAQSLVYFDPPYRPISKTSSFTSYIKGGFADQDQKRLKGVFDSLNKIGASVILSNSDPKNVDPMDEFFDHLYKKYTLRRLPAIRMINCNAQRRGKINEILVTNY